MPSVNLCYFLACRTLNVEYLFYCTLLGLDSYAGLPVQSLQLQFGLELSYLVIAMSITSIMCTVSFKTQKAQIES